MFHLPALLGALEAPRLTREIFGNISPGAKIAFYVLSAAAMYVLLTEARRRMQRWCRGRATQPRFAWHRIMSEILLQSRLRGRFLPSLAHRLLFSGFLVLFLGTCLVAAEHVLASLLGRDHQHPVFHYGIYYAIYELTLDLFGLVFLTGVVLFLVRHARKSDSFDRRTEDCVVLGLLLAIGITGYGIEGLRILREHTAHPEFSLVGWGCAQLWTKGGIVHADQIAAWHWALWWFHAILVLGLLASVPRLRLWHAVAGAVRTVTDTSTLGQLTVITAEDFERTGFVGVAQLTDLTVSQLTSLDACVACGRCEDACPAFAVGKPLSPKRVVQDLNYHWSLVEPVASPDRRPLLPLAGNVIAADTLWSCTTCSACADVCPLHVNPVELIIDLRRYLVGEGELRGSPANALQRTQRSGNPWGLPAQDRLRWADGLDVPTVATNPNFEVLYWVGCAAAYDRRVQKIAQSMVKLLRHAQVNFAVLGNEERCTGECQRRMGDEFLFQELAQANLDTLHGHQVRRIVTHCPHCLNSLRQDYAQWGGQFEVMHHSEFLAQLIQQSRLPTTPATNPTRIGRLTYHDPCYLARVQGQHIAPRQVLQATLLGRTEITELPRNSRDTACCGAGGGRMWMDDAVEQRIGSDRVAEVLASGADTVAVGCPFCLVMLGDGIAHRNGSPRVADISELLWQVIETGTQV